MREGVGSMWEGKKSARLTGASRKARVRSVRLTGTSMWEGKKSPIDGHFLVVASHIGFTDVGTCGKHVGRLKTVSLWSACDAGVSLAWRAVFLDDDRALAE